MEAYPPTKSTVLASPVGQSSLDIFLLHGLSFAFHAEECCPIRRVEPEFQLTIAVDGCLWICHREWREVVQVGGFRDAHGQLEQSCRDISAE